MAYAHYLDFMAILHDIFVLSNYYCVHVALPMLGADFSDESTTVTPDLGTSDLRHMGLGRTLQEVPRTCGAH